MFARDAHMPLINRGMVNLGACLIFARLQAHDTNVFDDSYLALSYNVAPQTFQPVVRLSPDTGERELTIMRWGLVPFWVKDYRMA